MGSEMLFSPRKQEKMKSNFAQTCTRFSHFLKERRSLGHLDTFKNIASSDNQIKGAAKDVSGPMNATAINMENERMSLKLFPFMSSSTVVGLESSSKNLAKSSELPKSKEEHKNTTTTPSMTIFYGGKVLVFDELPEDKAREIMTLVARLGTMSSHVQALAQTPTPTPSPHLTQDVVPQGASSVSDLPIARRVSLHRFMEKRKHRIAASAPYQIQTSVTPMSADSHPHKLKMMRSLYEKRQLELKL